MYSNSHAPQTRSGSIMFLLFIFFGVFLSTAGPSCAAESNGDAPTSGYIYPMKLHCGVLNALSGVNRDDAQVAIEMNFDRMSNILNPDFKVTLDFLPDAPVAADLIQQRQLHALSITGIDYIKLSRLAAVTPIFVASKLRESPLEPYVLLTRKGVSLGQLLAMDKRRLIVESNSAWDIGRIWLETVLLESGHPKSDLFFSSIQAATKPIRMVLPVFFGQAEASLVPKSVYDTMLDLNPQIGEKLHILIQSPGFVKNLFCIADYLDPKLVHDMKKALETMHQTVSGRQLLMIFQLRRNFPFKPDHLIETENVYRTFLNLKMEMDQDDTDRE